MVYKLCNVIYLQTDIFSIQFIPVQ